MTCRKIPDRALAEEAMKEERDGVRIFSVDHEALIVDLQRAARRLAEAHPEIEQIILFGSLVREDYGPSSDADLAIILSDSTKPMRERIPDYLRLPTTISVDVFPYTRSEFEVRLTEGDFFAKRILSQGRILFSKGTADKRR